MPQAAKRWQVATLTYFTTGVNPFGTFATLFGAIRSRLELLYCSVNIKNTAT